ncbi:MAG: GAF and ANTAR domain-containing protein [Marmoricola sp.]
MSVDPGSASFFARVSRDLMQVADERPTLQSVVERAVEVVPACDWASVTLRRRRNRTETVASSSEVAGSADQLQYDLDEGPCVKAARSGEPQLSNDLRHSREWPTWGPRVADLGVNAILAIELWSDDDVIGALNLYAAQVGAFTPDEIDVGAIYATHAANALTAARMATGLRTALQTRHLIGVAQGILMHGYDLTMEQSFELLRRYSSHMNTKLGDVAEHVVTHRTLPDDDGSR